jgi:hypothetical protein
MSYSRCTDARRQRSWVVRGPATLEFRAYASEAAVATLVRAGRLKYVLEDWRSMGPAFHIYYPSRRHVPVGGFSSISYVR